MKRHNGGFSLVEIVVAIAILGLFATTTCTSLVLALRMNDKTESMLQAQLAVSSAIETLMAEGIGEGSQIVTTDVSGTERTKETITYDRFADVTVIAEREKLQTETDYPPYYRVTASSFDGNVTVTTYIRKAVTS